MAEKKVYQVLVTDVEFVEVQAGDQIEVKVVFATTNETDLALRMPPLVVSKLEAIFAKANEDLAARSKSQ